ncbi:ACP S-malonyltransferase [Kineosporia corallincola]|uniref:ACP S-malonyltransferase n=1 Tax=Kineosporia corallincola TaxID=2835133 RepID=UPI0027DF508D|nr:ACP S-malonyltransferase [Kineosporia corallincola]
MSDVPAPVALLCPGQGAQRPGFTRAWMQHPVFARRMAELSSATGLDLSHHGTDSDAGTLRDTAVAQPLIVAAGLAAAALLPRSPADLVLAGHSVGEVTAAALAGVLSQGAAVTFVAERGRAMAAAAGLNDTGMSAVLGGDLDEVLTAVSRHGLVAANINGAGQVVAAGPLGGLAALAADPPAAARVRSLQVAGAFHTPHMAPAERALAGPAAALSPADPWVPLLSNADGTVLSDGAEVLRRLVSQVSRQVRWDLCMTTLERLGVRTVVELPPAGALSGLVKRALPGVRVISLRGPDDLDSLSGLFGPAPV